MNAVTVGRRHHKGTHYVGRPTPLGNPFIMHTEANRESVCNAYEVWFKAMLDHKRAPIMRELALLEEKARSGPLVLGCYCAPSRCHADTIAAYLNARLAATPGEDK